MTLKYEFKKANVNNRLDPANDNTKVQTLGKWYVIFLALQCSRCLVWSLLFTKVWNDVQKWNECEKLHGMTMVSENSLILVTYSCTNFFSLTQMHAHLPICNTPGLVYKISEITMKTNSFLLSREKVCHNWNQYNKHQTWDKLGATVWVDTCVLLQVFNLSNEIFSKPSFVVLSIFWNLHQPHSSISEEQIGVPVTRMKHVKVSITRISTKKGKKLQRLSYKCNKSHIWR